MAATEDNYKRLEEWIEKQIDLDTLPQEISSNIDNPDRIQGIFKNTLLNLYNRKVTEFEDKGRNTEELDGLREYVERKVMPDTKRERSFNRLFNKVTWKSPEGEEFSGWDIVEESRRIKEETQEEVRQAVLEEKEEKQSFQKLQSDIQTASPEELNVLLNNVRKSPLNKGEKEFLKRLINVEKTQTQEYKDWMEAIVAGIQQADDPSDLKNEQEKIKRISDPALRTDLERQWAEKKEAIGGVVQQTTKERLFGDFDEKMERAKEDYDADEEFISKLPKKQLSAFGFSKEEINTIKEYKGKLPKIEIAERETQPTITKQR